VARNDPFAFLRSKRRANFRKYLHDTQQNVVVATLYTLFRRYLCLHILLYFSVAGAKDKFVANICDYLIPNYPSLFANYFYYLTLCTHARAHTQRERENLAQIVTFLNFNTYFQGHSYSGPQIPK